MARKTGSKAQGNRHGNGNGRPRGPSSDSQALKTRSMDEVLGVEALDFGIENEVFTPKSGLRHLQLRSEVRHSFNEFMEVIHGSAKQMNAGTTRSQLDIGMVSIPILQQFDDAAKSEHSDNHSESTTDHNDAIPPIVNSVHIEIDDIQDEIDFWNSAVVCYVVGANPPVHVMEGYFRRIWRNFKVDKVVMVKKGVFLVRFMTMEARDKMLTGHYFFDKKPLIVRPWSVDMDIEKEEVQVIPIWIQLRLNFKYWGEKALFKIVGQIGNPVKRDSATINRDKLHYARVMVEVPMNQKLPESVSFVNEHGMITQVELRYEWRPTLCEKCQLIGHTESECRQNKAKKVWVQKQVQPVHQVRSQEVEVDQEGFQRALRPIRVRVSSVEPTQTANPFQLLNDEQQEQASPQLQDSSGDHGCVSDQMGSLIGRGNSSSPHG